MIKLFRKTRQRLLSETKFRRYLYYVFGEIFIVVLGVLIAIQINNINEAHKAQINERILLINLIQDLQTDSISFSQNLNLLKEINSLYKKLYEIGINNKQDLQIEKPNNIRRTPFFNPITQENDPAVAHKISNIPIRKEILNYFKYLKDLNFSYVEFDGVVRDNLRAYLRKEKVHDLSGWFENQSLDNKEGATQDFIRRVDLITISKKTAFQQLLLEVSLKSAETTENLEIVIDQNKKLMDTIRRELKK